MPRPQAVSLALAGLVLVLALLGIAFASLRSFERAYDLANHRAQVKEQLWRALQLLGDAETGQRGFLLTGDVAYLAPYEHAQRGVPEVIRDLRELVRDNPSEQASLAGLERLATAKLQVVGETVDLQRQGKPDAALALIKSARGKRIMGDLRAVQASMVRSEDALLARRMASARLFGRVSFGIIAAAGASLLVVGFLLLSVGRHVRELAETRIADLENFAGWVAHDIRTPLESVTSRLHMRSAILTSRRLEVRSTERRGRWSEWELSSRGCCSSAGPEWRP